MPPAQTAFIADYARRKRTLHRRDAIFVMDAVHPEHQVRSSHRWRPQRATPAVKTTTGRQRVNVLGALDVAHGQFIAREATSVTGAEVASLLRDMHAQLKDRHRKVHVYLDNAGYNRPRCVQQVVDELNGWLEVHYLPAYAPHLNPIERLWGVMHRCVTHNAWYADFKTFRERIRTFLYKEVTTCWDEFKTYVTDNFRVITHDGYAFYNNA